MIIENIKGSELEEFQARYAKHIRNDKLPFEIKLQERNNFQTSKLDTIPQKSKKSNVSATNQQLFKVWYDQTGVKDFKILNIQEKNFSTRASKTSYIESSLTGEIYVTILEPPSVTQVGEKSSELTIFKISKDFSKIVKTYKHPEGVNLILGYGSRDNGKNINICLKDDKLKLIFCGNLKENSVNNRNIFNLTLNRDMEILQQSYLQIEEDGKNQSLDILGYTKAGQVWLAPTNSNENHEFYLFRPNAKKGAKKLLGVKKLDLNFLNQSDQATLIQHEVLDSKIVLFFSKIRLIDFESILVACWIYEKEDELVCEFMDLGEQIQINGYRFGASCIDLEDGKFLVKFNDVVGKCLVYEIGFGKVNKYEVGEDFDRFLEVFGDGKILVVDGDQYGILNLRN